MIGKTISHYKILGKLGEGGMGVVYKAQDTKLKRTVALKFLPPHVLGSDEEKDRFVREAQAAAALNHPNICTIHEIDEYENPAKETADKQTFIAMEYIEGQSLKEKIESGPLKLNEVKDVGIQIAEGLQEAHNKGIIHRDIKSANIMLTVNDRVKITDFGLAKLFGKTQLTKTGSTVGTTSYMSPEQAQGEKVDHRSDIWSVGVVLYEMICGKLPFQGEYDQAVMYNILNQDPEPLTGLRTGIPIELERIVNKTLAKETGDRYQHIDELPVDLNKIDLTPSNVSDISRNIESGSIMQKLNASRDKMPWKFIVQYLTLAVIFGFVIGWFSHTREKLPLLSKKQFVHKLQPDEEIGGYVGTLTGHELAISPDGSKIVYVSNIHGVQKIHMRQLSEIQTKEIEGTDGAKHPFFSPDSREL